MEKADYLQKFPETTVTDKLNKALAEIDIILTSENLSKRGTDILNDAFKMIDAAKRQGMIFHTETSNKE